MRLILVFIFYLSSASIRLFAEEPIISDIEVVPASESERILSSVPLKTGDLWNESLLGLVERYLESTQRYDQIRVSWLADEEVLRIEVNPRIFFEEIVWTEYVPSERADIESTCIFSRENVVLSQSRITQINQCVLQKLQQQGFLDAKVLLIPNGTQLQIELLPGDRYRVSRIYFQGNDRLGEAYLRRGLANRVGRFFNPFQLDEDTAAIRRAYLRRGYYLTEVFRPNIQVIPADKSVEISWRVNESDRVEIEFEGYYRSKRFLTEMVDRGESLPEWYIEEVMDQIRQELISKGYLEVKVESEERQITENFRRVLIRVERGYQYRLLEPEFIGLNDPERILKIFSRIRKIQPGRHFNEEEFRANFEEDFFRELLEEGYVDAKVRTIEFSIDRSRAAVQPLIYMNEGRQYRIEIASLSGVPNEFHGLDSYELLQEAIQTGNIFNPLKNDELQNALAKELIEHGFLDVKIERVNESLREGGFRFEIQVETGPRYKIAEILVRGLDKTNPEVIYRELLFSKGEYYSRQTINDTISQILRLGIARSVDIRVFEKVSEKEIVYLLVDVLEAARFRFELGPGYGTIDGLRGIFRATYANIGGTGRRLTFSAKASRKLEEAVRPTDVLNDDSEPVPFIQRRVITEYFEPSLLQMPVDGRLTLSHRKESVDGFDLLSNAFTGSLDYRITRHWTYSPEYRIEYSNPFNVPIASETIRVDDTSPKRLHSLGQNLYAVYLDDNFSPQKGFRNLLRFELFDERLGGNLNFWLLSTKQEFFIQLWRWFTERNLSFALALNSGFSKAYSETADVPVEKRYRVGGESSVRGYRNAGIEPLDADGEPLRNGGRSFFYFRSELAIPVAGSLDLLGFLDGGNIYPSNKDFDPTSLRYGTGAGIRFNTPVGPLKLGYAFVLDRREGEDIGQIYFGVGPL